MSSLLKELINNPASKNKHILHCLQTNSRSLVYVTLGKSTIHTHHTASYAHHLKLSKGAVNQEKSTVT